MDNYQYFSCKINRYLLLMLQVWIFFIFSGLPAAAQEIKPDIRQLMIGERTERKVTGQELHVYGITLTRGQVLRVNLLEKGADVQAVIGRDADGQKVSVLTNSGTGFMRESLTMIADRDGVYGLIVRAQQITESDLEAKYEFNSFLSDSASYNDTQRIQGEKLIEEAHQIYGNNDKEKLPLAIVKLEESLKIWRLLGDKYWQAVVMTILGNVGIKLENYSKAETNFLEALNLFDKVKENPEVGNVYIGLGTVYSLTKNEEKARTYVDLATRIFRDLGDNRSEKIANLLNLRDLGELKDGIVNVSLPDYNKEMAVARARKGKAAEVSIWAKTLVLYALKDEEEVENEARRALLEKTEREGLPLSRVIKDRSAEMRILFGLGAGYAILDVDDTDDTKRKANIEKSKNYLLQALLLSKTLNDPLFECFVYAVFKGIYEEDEDSDGLNIFFGKKAINVLQDFRQTVKIADKETQQEIARYTEEIYEEFASELISEEGRFAEALQILNLGRDQEFFDFKLIENQKPDRLTWTPREAENKVLFDNFVEKVGTKYAGRPTADYQIAANELKPILAELSRNFDTDNTAKDVVGSVPDLSDMQFTLRELSLKTGKKHATLYVSSDLADILLITTESIEAFGYRDLISESGKYSETLFNKVSEQVNTGMLSREKAIKKLEEAKTEAQKHYQELVSEQSDDRILEFLEVLHSPQYDPRPLGSMIYERIFKKKEAGKAEGITLEEKLAQYKPDVLLWSLRGKMRYIPVAALYDKERKQYLVEKYENVLFTRARKERFLSEPRPWTNGMGFGAPDAPGFNPIPFAKDEILTIFGDSATKQKGFFDGRAFIGREFTRQALLTVPQTKPAFVHIASHFNFSPGDAGNSFLVLGDGNKFSLIDMRQNFGLFAGVDLLILSACETAAQRSDAKGKEIDGFAELAQRLGANSVIATLWEVNDEGTSKLMSEFYRFRQENSNASKSEILRLAQLRLLNGKGSWEDGMKRRSSRSVKVIAANNTSGTDKEKIKIPFNRDSEAPFEHPYYWAPFVLFGNSNGGRSVISTVMPKPAVNYNGNSSSGELREIRPSDLIGRWEGLFDQAQYTCILEIERVEGNTFYGKLKPPGMLVEVIGNINPRMRQISFIETKAIPLDGEHTWTLGRNWGTFSNDGNFISGTGEGGTVSYKWSFSKRNSDMSINNFNSPMPKVTIKEIELSFKSNLFDETIQKSRALLEAEPNNMAAHGYLGFSLLIKKQTDEAVFHLGKVITAGNPLSFSVKRGKANPLVLGHLLEDSEITISKDQITLKNAGKIFQSDISTLPEVRLENYQNLCPYLYVKGFFVETREKSAKTKQELKEFWLFPTSATLQPVQQNNLTLYMISCRDEGILSTALVKLINEIRLQR